MAKLDARARANVDRVHKGSLSMYSRAYVTEGPLNFFLGRRLVQERWVREGGRVRKRTRVWNISNPLTSSKQIDNVMRREPTRQRGR